MTEPAPARPVPSNPPLLERRRDVVVLGGAIEPAGVAALCERARPLLAEIAAHDVGALTCEIGSLRSDLAAVDAVARLALMARRLDRSIRLLDAPPTFRGLLVLAGLVDVVPCDPGRPGSGLDPGR